MRLSLNSMQHPQEAMDVVAAVGDMDKVAGCLRSRFPELGVEIPY